MSIPDAPESDVMSATLAPTNVSIATVAPSHFEALHKAHTELLQEVTARRAIEVALRESEARYRALVESSMQGISIVTQEGRRVFANQRLMTMLGYESLETYLRHDPLDNVAPHERARLRGYREALGRGESVPMPYTYEGVRADGTPLWLEGVAAPIIWEGTPAFLSTLLTLAVRQAGDLLVVTVRDQGRGIPPAELETIFAPFVQSSTTMTGAGGTGLGLSICRDIVTAHHGRIWAANDVHGGAVLTLALPLGQPPTPEATYALLLPGS